MAATHNAYFTLKLILDSFLITQ